MPILPSEIMALLQVFAPVFSERIFEWVKVLVVGAILALNKRMVTAALQVMGLNDEAQVQNNHRILSRVQWGSLEVSQPLLGLTVTDCGGEQVAFGQDTIYRMGFESKEL